MSFSVSDIAEFKWSLGAFVLSMVVAAGLSTFSEDYRHGALQAKQSAQEQLNKARENFATAQNDFENMATYKLEYEALETQKVIGNEQRLDWIEGLEKIRKQGAVLDFKYSVGPQQSYAPNPPLDTGNFALNLSPMTLQIDLLHEEQLDRLFSTMATQMEGWFILDRCSLSAGASATGEATSLKADCAGGWLTMKNRSAP
ncbi:MAG: hypothetical protein FD121_967 [Gallionellaceae bacterium]|nr:MAG: hypothetical protein FD121_967 [Gallionellaceae bacterium]